MRICIDMDTLQLVACHTEARIRDGLAHLEGTRSHHLFYDDAESDDFLENFTTLELDTLAKNLIQDESALDEIRKSQLDDFGKRYVIAAFCNSMKCRKVDWDELESQIEVMSEFLEDDPDTAPRFRYVRGARVPQVLDEN